MIPVTYPSSLSYRTTRQMVAYPITDLTGKRRWTDYIPVKFVDQTTFTVENSHNNNAYISVDMLSSNANLKEGIDYIPVYIDDAATDAWQVSATGYIPVGYSGAALSLQFAGSTFLDSRITFTRASSGTYFDNTGVLRRANRNLLTYSEQFDNAAWTKSQASITANTAIAPDGASTADKIVENTATNPHYFDQATTTTAANHAFSVYLKAGERTAALLYHVQSNVARVFDLSLGALGGVAGLGTPVDSSIVSVGNGWYRCTIVATATAASNQFRVYTMQNLTTYNYTGNGTSGIFIWGAQLEEGSTATQYAKTVASTSGAPRFDHDPVTKAPRGLLIEEQRTNSIRNNTMVGAVAGTPGTGPTNWSLGFAGTGVTRQIVGTGVENGINYIDIRYSGTATSGITISIASEPNNGVAAANGQTWTYSTYVKIAAGSFTGFNTPQILIDEYSAAVGYLTGQVTNLAIPTSAFTRVSATRTLNNASTAFVVAGYRFYANSGNTVDITLRIGLPQLEQGAFATSVIPTSGTATTRAADSASMTGTNFSSWYRQDEGTFYTESQILYSTGGTLFPGVFSANNGTTTNAIMSYYLNTDRQNLWVRSSGTIVTDIGSASTANALFKFAGAFKVNDFAATSNGLAVVTDTAGALPATLDRLVIGSQALGNGPLNGHIRKLAFYPARLSNAQLQSLTR